MEFNQDFNNASDWINTHLDIQLEWMRRTSEFDRDHLAILIKCSHKNRVWITYGELAKIGINEDTLKNELAYLLSIRVLLYRVDKSSNSYFALRERIED